jgi:hypothetical protein
MCTYVAMVYGILYLWFTTIPTVFEDTYGWKASFTGLAYLGRKSLPSIILSVQICAKSYVQKLVSVW